MRDVGTGEKLGWMGVPFMSSFLAAEKKAKNLICTVVVNLGFQKIHPRVENEETHG